MAMLRWAYTDELELSQDDAFLIELMKLANCFQLQLLRERSAQDVHIFSFTPKASTVARAHHIL